MMTSIDNEQSKAEARAAREQSKAEARAAREQAKAETRAAREQAKAETRAAREQAKAETRAAREQAKAEAKAKAKAEAQAARERARAAWHCRLVHEQSRMRRTQRALNARKLKVIKTKDLEKEMEDVCIICLEKHQFKDCILTSCNHIFGFECFQEFINANENYNKHCPMCRNPEYRITSFKSRKPPTRKNNDTPPPKFLFRRSKTFFL
jgi:hypothetical protein